MAHEHRMLLIVIGIVLMALGGKRTAIWVGRYLVQMIGRLLGHRWHGFPYVHRVKRISCTKEWFTGERIEVFGGGIRAESVRKKSKLTYCTVCGKTVSEEPIGSFIYSSRGGEARIA